MSWLLAVMAGLSMRGQPMCDVAFYDEDDGVPSSHVTQLLQDERGLMWFSTWNGLCRYDGYEFRTFKPQVGDGCHMTMDRIRRITLMPDGNILCGTDLGNFVFDRRNYRFRDLRREERTLAEGMHDKYRQSRSMNRDSGFSWTDEHKTRWTLSRDGRLRYRSKTKDALTEYPTRIPSETLSFALADRRGNLWVLDNKGIFKLTTGMQTTRRMDIAPQGEVKCLFADSKGRVWVTTKEDGAVRAYQAATLLPEGYLGADGRIHREYVSFGAPIYCMHEQKDGTLWLGSKPQGLFRLRPTGTGGYDVDHLSGLPHTDVYHIAEDRRGRLWVATLGGGILYTDHPEAREPCFRSPSHYPRKEAPRVRYLFMGDKDIMMAATSNGLVVARIAQKADDTRFLLHQRETDRSASLSCSATMDVAQDRRGRVFVSTESGGINLIATANLLDSTLEFKHLRDELQAQPNDVVQAMAPTADGGLIVVGSHLVTLLDSALHGKVLDAAHFHANYRFSEAHPLPLQGGRWLFGLTDGAFLTSADQMRRQAYCPHIVLTEMNIQGSTNWAVEHLDTVTLMPGERNMALHFAAIDYQAPHRISYAFQLMTDSQRDSSQWNYIGHNRSVTLPDLEPATYQLVIRSTNADGEWQDNHRRLTIVVKPTFMESATGRLLTALLIMALAAAMVYTYIYIRRIKRQQRETLNAYLALIEKQEQRQEQRERGDAQNETAARVATDDPIIQRVMAFIDANIGNSEANVGDMAAAAATSRSGLQRKLRQAMGITPQDLMREARIKRACQLLRQTDRTVAEVAYACGFSDPKYFSRSFKQTTGISPSEFKTKA